MSALSWDWSNRSRDDIYLFSFPGGLFMSIIREPFLQNDPELMKLEQLMQELEDQRKWKKLKRVTFPEYVFEIKGVLHVYQCL